MATIGANRASVFIHLMPLFGAVLAITFLGEQLATITRSARRWCWAELC